jgi:chemotaxis signal transduction protein
MDGVPAGGILLRVGGELRFLATSIAVRVMPLPPVTAIPGSARQLLGIALYEGGALPVIAIGPRRDAMVICQHAGELVGLVGAEVVQAGWLGAELDGVPPSLDIAAIYGAVQRG